MDGFEIGRTEADIERDAMARRILILFSSYYFADRSDKMLEDHGVPHQLMPVPPELSSACGLAIGVEEQYMEHVLKIFEVKKITPSHMYYYEKGKVPIVYM